MKLQNILNLIMLTSLAACSGEKTHDVQYYLDNAEERIAKLKDCENNPGEKMNTPNCQNAAAAMHKVIFRGKEMPHIR
jgi:hypothetical protein